MNIIKLDATDSTNDYLKQLCANKSVDNLTVVVAKNQTKGKGQMGAIWNSEIGKNLTFSILIKNNFFIPVQIFDLNVLITTSIFVFLEDLNVPDLAIKWPNDILSGNQKICGILIENSFKADKSIESLVGIGLNVNQSDFENLPKATSLSKVMKQEYDLDILLGKLVEKIELNYKKSVDNNFKIYWNFYRQHLFCKNTIMKFETPNGVTFSGKIIGVNKKGLLEVFNQENKVKTFNIKEIQLLY